MRLPILKKSLSLTRECFGLNPSPRQSTQHQKITGKKSKPGRALKQNRSLHRGEVIWVELNPTKGREQSGRRPAVVISSDLFLSKVDSLVVVIPATSVNRGWPNHVPINGGNLKLSAPTFAMTEQPRTITRERIGDSLGFVSAEALREIDMWLKDFLGLYC